MIFFINESANAQMKEDIRKEIEKIIYYDTDIKSKDIPGFSIGLLYSDSVFIYHFGSADTETKKSLSDSTAFELGGLSKVFTASLIEILVQDSILQYDKPFNDYLDSSFQNKHLKDLTILDLISHQSRLPKMPYEFGVKEKEVNNPYAHYTKNDLLEFYKKYFVDKKDKKEYFYSNINFALLEIAIENATGLPFEEVINQRLFQPLHLNNTYVHNDLKNGKSPSPGYSISRNLVTPLTFQSFAGSEGIKSSILDLTRFVQASIGKPTTELTSSLENIQEPLGPTNLNKYAKVAKGWHVFKHKKYYNTILHSGSTNGHRAYIGFVKETETAVVMLSNSEHGTDGLGFLILRMLNHNWKKKK